MNKIIKRLIKIIKMFYSLVFVRSKKANKKKILFKLLNPKPMISRSYSKIKDKVRGKADVEELTVDNFRETITLIIIRRITKQINWYIEKQRRKIMPVIHIIKRRFRSLIEIIKSLSNEAKNIATDKIVLKLGLLVVMILIMLTRSFSWFYNEYISNGAIFDIGSIEHQVNLYDDEGTYITEAENPATIVYEANMGVTTKTSKFIEVSNIGTLDMEYDITFQLDGTVGNAGVMYYRLFDITSEVEAAVTDEQHPTKIEAYAYDNPIDPDIEEDTVHPIYNMSTVGNYVKHGTIHVENESTDSNPRYYRLDYGMYEAVNSSLYSGESIAVHMSVYSTQIGLLAEGDSSEIYGVSIDTEFRDAVNTALSGDTIRLLNDINVTGSIDFSKRINLDTNGYTLSISGDLVYDFVETGDMVIDVTDTGKLEIGNQLYINTPKTKVDIIGENKAYDIYVGGTMTVSGLQDGEEEGILLESVSIVKSTSTLVPIDMLVKSNTRLVIAPEVTVGLITAVLNSTNIEIVNNGTITQIQLQDMNLLSTFTKPQIYIYNLGTIYGVLGSSSIILPPDATPYISPTNGNTLIIKGVNSNDITVEGSDYFDQGDIEYNEDDNAVTPIAGENNAYTVCISQAADTVEGLLEDYFTDHNYPDVPAAIAAIDKLVIYTINGQYMENNDFDFLKSSDIPIITYLDLENARVKDDTTLNQIKASALSGKTSLLTVILPKTVTSIGASAFYNIGLGIIPVSPTDDFNILSIPASVTSIGASAFNSSKYIEFLGNTPPTVTSGAFNTADSGAKFFVKEGVIATYQAASNLNSSNIFQEAYISDNRLYFVYDNDDGIGIAYSVNDTTEYTTVGVPTDLDIDSYSMEVNAIGTNAYRHTQIDTGGANLSLPSTVTEIDAYAFYALDLTSANLTYIQTVGDYAFYNTSLGSIIANSITSIGNHTFELTDAATASFTSLTTLGSYALASSPDLYQVNLGDVTAIGSYALYDCKNLARVYFETISTTMVGGQEQINISVGENSTFSNWGYYIDGRLRVYVPDGTTSESNTYLELYKNKFSTNEQYIFVTGSSVGSYYYYSVPYDLTNYTVREVTIDDYQDNPITGWEIISYQGADLDDTYNIPTSLTVGSTTHNVISIGKDAYKNVTVTTAEIVDLSSSYLLNIDDDAFNGVALNSITANNVVTIGEYALASTTMQTASFDHLSVLNDYGLYDNDDLYSLNLGNVQAIGANSVAENTNLERLYFTNTGLNTLIVGTPFTNTGSNTDERFRIYVPNGDTYIDYYKSIISLDQYVYGTGSFVGSYVDTNGHDIGDYAVREVTKNNYSGTPVTGWEIIEYHGDDLTSAYSIPTTFTVGATTHDVISIGRDAYVHAVVTTSNELDLTNTYLINIGDNAFKNLEGLDTLSASSLVTVGANAFDGSTLTSGTFAHLNTLEGDAFANDDTLYYLNLGTVKVMAENSLHNLDRLSQVYFTATDTSLTFDTDAITDIGSMTGEHLRLYVTDGNSGGGTPWVDVYKALFSSAYTGYWYRSGSIVGSYQHTGIPYNIGDYSVREVTLSNYLGSNVTGWELIEYHGDDLTDSYNFPTSVTVGSTTHDVISIGEYAYKYVVTNEGATIDLSSTYMLKIGKEAFYNVEGLYTVTTDYVTTLGEKAFQNTNLVSASFAHLSTTGNYALANIDELNYVNLGTCGTLGEYLLYNDSSVEQIFMSNVNYGTSQMNITIGTGAFSGTATSIGDRVRVYVPDGIATGSTTYVTLYKATLPSNINPYVYATGSLYGSYTQTPEPYDIGQYMVKEVTVNGNNGWEIVDYHGADITNSYSIPDSLTINSVTKNIVSIGDYAYRYTSVGSGQTWSLILPNTVVKVGDYAFYTRGMVSVTGNAMYSIGTYAFAQCTNLVSVDFNSNTTIATYAFYLNTAMTSASIGTGTTSIGNYAFYQVAATNVLTSFYTMATSPPTVGTSTFPLLQDGNTKPSIYVPSASYNSYHRATTWKKYTLVRVNTPYNNVYNYNIINTNEIEITSYTGNDVTLNVLDTFTIDSTTYNVTAIAQGWLDTNTNVKYVELPQYLNIIPNDICGTSSKCESFTVDSNNTYFTASSGVLFNYNSTTLLRYPTKKSGSSYTVPTGVTSIAVNAFKNNTTISTITIPSSVTVISSGAFDGCTSMRTYHIQSSTPTILTGFKVFPYYSNMYIYVPSAAESTYEAHYAYYYYRSRIYGE